MDNQNAEKIALFERTRRVAGQVCFDPVLRQDVAQEAWLKCLEYAETHRRPLGELSATEIRHRCFEAFRKLKPKETFLAYEEEDSIMAPTPNPFEETLATEMEKLNAETAGKAEWILREHPALKLTPTQWEVYYELGRVIPSTENVWRARFARKVGTTRQNIWNIERVVKQKAVFARDLVELWNGDVVGFFTKYGKTWWAPEMRMMFKSVAVERDHSLNRRMHAYFEKIQREMFKHAEHMLRQEARRFREEESYDASRILVGYHLMRRATFINTSAAAPLLSHFQEEFGRGNWLMGAFLAGRFRFVSGEESYAYNNWLKDLIQRSDEESARYAAYIACRHGAVSGEQMEGYLQRGGSTISSYDAAHLVREIYKYLHGEGDYDYFDGEGDGTFLSLVLPLKLHPQRLESRTTENSLRSIGQMFLHSKDSFVAKQAEQLLARMRR